MKMYDTDMFRRCSTFETAKKSRDVRERTLDRKGKRKRKKDDRHPIIAEVAEDRLVRPKIVHVEPRHHLALKFALSDKSYHSPNEHDLT